MNNIYIICIEDQREVLNAIVEDLSEFEEAFIVEECESADEAEELLDDIEAEGDYLGLVVSDHVMPGKSGVEFLTELHGDERFEQTKKILLTGLATHQDTIQAINQAAIDRYIEKPWQSEKLVQYAKELLTQFIIQKGIDYQSYIEYLDKPTLFELLRVR
jgi:two-component system chemotaxis response regulator CheY